MQLTPEEIFRHYFKRLSQRGWGRFEIERLDPSAGDVSVRLEHSVFVLEHSGPASGGLVLYVRRVCDGGDAVCDGAEQGRGPALQRGAVRGGWRAP